MKFSPLILVLVALGACLNAHASSPVLNGMRPLYTKAKAGDSAWHTDSTFLDTDGQDNRVAMTSTAYPWSAVGRVWQYDGTEFVSICTGTLVGRRLMLTAAHCVLDDSNAIQGVHFQPGYMNGAAAAQFDSVSITVGTTDTDANPGDDWALVVLNGTPGDTNGYLGSRNIQDDGTALPLAVSLAGYSSDFDNGDTACVDTACSILDIAQGELLHNCSMTHGASGGSLFSLDSDAQYRVVGVNVAEISGGPYATYSPNVANIAVWTEPLSNQLDELRTQEGSQ